MAKPVENSSTATVGDLIHHVAESNKLVAGSLQILANHAKQETEHRVFPYLHVREAYLIKVAANEKATRPQLIESIKQMMKNRELSPVQVMDSLYYLLGDDKDRAFYVSMIVGRVSDEEKIIRHNHRMSVFFGEDDPSFITTWGDLITTMPWPLFPTLNELGDLG